MKLRSSPPSPFGRKIKMAARMLGVFQQIEVITSDTMDAGDSLRVHNPLGKIPALTLDDGTVLYDSRVIVEYLDHLAGSVLIPVDPARRFRALTLQALCDGLMDASILQRYEAMFHEPAQVSAKWLDHQKGKVARGLAALEAAPPSGEIDIGHVTLACALGYLDLRFEGAWRKGHPKLVAWLDDFAGRVPAFAETKVVL